MSTTKKYWAGGHDWKSKGPQKDRFIAKNEWQMGFDEKDSEAHAQRMLELFKQIEIGDEFAIKGAPPGRLNIYYVGRVTDIVAATNTLKLEPLDRPLYSGERPRGKDAGAFSPTLWRITRPDVIDLIFHGSAPLPKTFPLNQILYGPPGTGKTYSTIRRAVEIVDGAAPQEQRECKARFDALMNAGRIAFVTFHQSFALRRHAFSDE